MSLDSCYTNKLNWVSHSICYVLRNIINIDNKSLECETLQADRIVVRELYAQDFTVTSDARYKKNIKKLEDYPIDNLKNIKCYSFKYKTGENKKKVNKKHYGLIAQEVEKIDANLVCTDEKGKKSVYYQELIPLMMEYIHTLENRISSLENN